MFNETSSTNAYENYYRKRSIKDTNTTPNDIKEFMRAHPDVNYRYFIQSDDTLLSEYRILEFGHDFTDPLVSRGESDAKKVIEMGPGKSFDKLR